VADQYIGQTGPCAACGQTVTVPDLTPLYISDGPPPQGSSGRWIISLVTRLALILFCIGLPIFLLLPAVYSAREAARRSSCNGNLTGIVLSLHNYHDTFKMFPTGVQIAGGVNAPGRNSGEPVLGPSWWYGILPFIEQHRLYDRIHATQQAAQAAPVFNAHQLNDPAFGIPGAPLANWASDYMVLRCPSTPLPLMETSTGPLALPSYVGISGGTDISNTSADYASGGPQNRAPVTDRPYVNQYKGTGPRGSIVTSSGMLPPAQHVTMADCVDGGSNTMIVSEQSDWLRDVRRKIRRRYHGDPGWNHKDDGWQPRVGAGGFPTASAGGWISGTEDAVTPVGRAANISDHSSDPGDWMARSLFNITTVRYPVDLKRVMNVHGDGYPGCRQVMGHNNPLQSPHPGGVMAAFADGSRRFISDTTDLAVLLRMAIRNDGRAVQRD
jgi:prepilin-type processing-associated H-X9-DG protein